MRAEDTLQDPLVRAFEASTVDPDGFHHREHLYVGWCYLRALPLEAAQVRYLHHLRQLTIVLGVPEKFSEPTTRHYLVLLDAAMRRSAQATTFDELLAAHPELTRRSPG